jgi:hypothetical protein
MDARLPRISRNNPIPAKSSPKDNKMAIGIIIKSGSSPYASIITVKEAGSESLDMPDQIKINESVNRIIWYSQRNIGADLKERIKLFLSKL